MIILGVDPGTRFSGYSILKREKSSIYLITCDFLRLSSQKPLPERVFEFCENFEHIINKYEVTDISLETPFLGKNAQNFLKLGYLRGILYFLAQKHKLKILEFTPREVKLAITGFGGASKDQVSGMVHKMFPRLPIFKRDDVTDAVAISLCAAWQIKNLAASYEV
ncbi:TPA: crossover junction endodeoxyribonuclease RuvC [Candidatus Dependentiae bacterium]|nr:crossover junction endodeoxyribonuclease RuvC [Candidatus Dependentiae bacterium]